MKRSRRDIGLYEPLFDRLARIVAYRSNALVDFRDGQWKPCRYSWRLLCTLWIRCFIAGTADRASQSAFPDNEARYLLDTSPVLPHRSSGWPAIERDAPVSVSTIASAADIHGHKSNQ
jgi:hypothetical protein